MRHHQDNATHFFRACGIDCIDTAVGDCAGDQHGVRKTRQHEIFYEDLQQLPWDTVSEVFDWMMDKVGWLAGHWKDAPGTHLLSRTADFPIDLSFFLPFC